MRNTVKKIFLTFILVIITLSSFIVTLISMALLGGFTGCSPDPLPPSGWHQYTYKDGVALSNNKYGDILLLSQDSGDYLLAELHLKLDGYKFKNGELTTNFKLTNGNMVTNNPAVKALLDKDEFLFYANFCDYTNDGTPTVDLKGLGLIIDLNEDIKIEFDYQKTNGAIGQYSFAIKVSEIKRTSKVRNKLLRRH